MNKEKFMSHDEMFPEQLGDKKDKDRFINFIKVEDMRNFVKECIDHAGYEVTDYEHKVAEIVLDTMIKKELLSPTNHQNVTDMLLAGAYLHNIYFDEEKIATSLFKARIEFDPIAEKYGFPEMVREMVWDAIEGQLGDLTPIAKVKPSPNTPQDMLANCIWIVRNVSKWFF